MVEFNILETPSGREPLLYPGRRGCAPGSEGLLQAPESNSSRMRPFAGAQLLHKRLIYKPSQADIIYQPQGQEKGPDTGATKTHERQRDAGNRHKTRNHTDIDQNMEQQQS